MADAAVRPARPEDISEIARIQRDTWRTAYVALLPPAVLAGLDVGEISASWQHALEHGPARLFVATEADWIVGFCAAGPAPSDEVSTARGGLPADANTVALFAALLVEPRWGRRGHGGRLLAATATTLRAAGLTRGVIWVPEDR